MEIAFEESKRLRTKDYIFFFAVTSITVFLIYSLSVATDITWRNTNVDSAIFIWAAERIGLIHPTGAPLYVFGNQVWGFLFDGIKPIATALALQSAFFSALTAGLIQFEILRNNGRIITSLIAVGVYLGSAVVFSQSVIAEMYTLAGLFTVAMYVLRDTRWPFVIVAALSLGVHHVVGLAMLPILVWRFVQWRRGEGPAYWKADLLIPLGMLLYVPYWAIAEAPGGGLAWGSLGFLEYMTTQGFMFMGLPPEDMGLQRLYEFAFVFFGGFGIASIAVIMFGVAKRKEDWLLVALAAIPFAYYATHLLPQAYTYTIPGFIFAAILIGKHLPWNTPFAKVITVSVLALVLINIQLYDLNREGKSSARNYVEAIECLPPESVVLAKDKGWEKLTELIVENDVQIYTDVEDVPKGLEITHASVTLNPSRYSSAILPIPETGDDC